MKTMKHFRRKNGVKGISLVLCVAMMFNMAVPAVVLAQTNDPPYSTESSLNEGDGCTDDPIDTKNGNNYFTEKRIFVPCPGNGLDLGLNLKYQSVADLPAGICGEGWRHSYEWLLDVQSGEAMLYTGNGKKKVFEGAVGGGYLSPKKSNWTLEETATGYEVGMPGGVAYIFDSSGQLDLIQDAWGNWVECSHGTNGCLESATHSNGRQIVFSNELHAASSEWRVVDIQVVGGSGLSFAYNSDGQFSQVVEQVGSSSYTSRYQYAEGFLTNKVNGAGFEYTFEYETDQYGGLNGKGTHLAVDGYYEHEVEYVDPDTTDVRYFLRGAEQVYRYSRNGNGILATKHGPAGNVSEALTLGVDYSYAANDEDKIEETLFDDVTGATWSEWMLHDDRHNTTNHAVSYCSTMPVHQFSTEYDPVWQLPTAFVDAESFREETVYTNGLPLVEKVFHSTTESFDTCYAYTTNGLEQAVTNANGHVVSHTHDFMGNRVSVAAELGPVITNTFDSLGFVKSTEILSESGASTGRITQYGNDAKGRVVQTTHPDGLVESFTYNALGYPVGIIDRAGRRTDHTYAPSRKLTSVTRYLSEGGSNTPVRIGYDLDQQLNVLRISEPRGRYVESYQLDIQDRVTSVTNIEGQVMTVDYTVGDFVSQTVRLDGTSTTNTYDNAGQKETTTYNPGSASPVTIAFSYYADGELKTIADGLSSVSNSFDRLNRLTNQIVQVGNLQSEIDNAFDPVGNVTNTVVDLGGSRSVVTAYTYDEAERLNSISTAPTNSTFLYSYSPVNGLVESVSNTVSGITCSYEYNLMDRATNIAYRASDGSLIRSLEYEYDAASMIARKTINGGTASPPSTSYVYDSLDRLVHESRTADILPAQSKSYSYDLAGNRLSKTEDGLVTSCTLGIGNRLASTSTSATNTLFVTGTANELIGTDERWGELWVTNLTAGTSGIPSVNGNSFFAELPALAGQTNTVKAAIRDRAGNMGYATKDYWVGTAGGTSSTSSYSYSAAGCLTNLNGVSLEWDERYRLESVSSATSAVGYTYDVLDRRTSRIENGTTNYFVYNNQQVVADLNGSGSMIRSYVWGAGVDNLLSFTDHTTSNTYYAIKDHQNTVIALADETGVVVESYEYDAYGNTKVFDGSGVEMLESALGNRYAFQGREIDWDTGLYYFRARWYDPGTGRWLSKDPIGIAGGLNQYVFGGNNPVNKVDPYGQSWGLVAAIGAGVTALLVTVAVIVTSPVTITAAAVAGAITVIATIMDIKTGADKIDEVKESFDKSNDVFKERNELLEEICRE